MRGHWHGCGPDEGAPRARFIFGGRRGFSFGPDGFHFNFDGERGRGGGSGGGRGRNRKRMFGSGELRLVLLKLIADEPRHGYDLIRAIEELTGGDYAPSPGTIYPTLTMLTDMGLIEEQAAEGARKAFAVTKEGKAHLKKNEDEVEALFERLEEAAPDKDRAGHPPIGRAIGNLMAALRHRVAHDGFDEALVHEITEILDEAAQRIERVK